MSVYENSKIRSFIAIEPPAAIRERIGLLTSALESMTGGVRWNSAEQLHVTLSFLGSVEPHTLDQVSASIKNMLAGQRFSPFSLELKGIGFFPSPQRPRVVWLGVYGQTDPLLKLQEQVVQALKHFPVEREEGHSYHPHVTLGRVRKERRLRGLESLLKVTQELSLNPFTVQALHLFESQTSPQGSRYIKLESFPFGQ